MMLHSGRLLFEVNHVENIRELSTKEMGFVPIVYWERYNYGYFRVNKLIPMMQEERTPTKVPCSDT